MNAFTPDELTSLSGVETIWTDIKALRDQSNTVNDVLVSVTDANQIKTIVDDYNATLNGQ